MAPIDPRHRAKSTQKDRRILLCDHEGPDSSADLYNKAYDLWFNTAPTTTGQPNGAELMIWLGWHGEQPASATNAQDPTSFTTQGANFEVWLDPPNGHHSWYIISFRLLTSTVPSISNLEVDNLDLLRLEDEAKLSDSPFSHGVMWTIWLRNRNSPFLPTSVDIPIAKNDELQSFPSSSNTLQTFGLGMRRRGQVTAAHGPRG